MSVHYVPAKLLLCSVGRHRGEKLVEAAKAAGARGGTIAPGRSTDGNPILQALALSDIQLDLVFFLMRAECAAVLEALKAAASRSPKKLGGKAYLLDVSGMLMRQGTNPGANMTDAAEGSSGRMIMESGHTLITVIVNHGSADDVMALARKAGAGGGTICNARGTGTEEDVKFFGITLVPEKEMLFIAVENQKVKKVLEAVNCASQLCEPGGGIAFTLKVEEFVKLGG